MFRTLTIALATAAALGTAAVGTASTADAGIHIKFGFHGHHHKPFFHGWKPYYNHYKPHHTQCFWIYKWGHPKYVCS